MKNLSEYNYFKNIISEYLDITLSSSQIESFNCYYEMLMEWNKVMNLTAITDYHETLVKHFMDSLMISRILDLNKISRMIDVGTGAGFPGIPVKIVYPHIKLVLLDSLNKRIKFLNAVTETLELENVSTLHGRAEDYAKKPEYREKFDLCVSRAVANLSTLSEYSLPFIKKNGYFVAYKSGNCEEEIEESKNAVKILGGEIKRIDKFELPGTDMRRALVQIEKVKNTPGRYPRKAGTPAKEPLK